MNGNVKHGYVYMVLFESASGSLVKIGGTTQNPLPYLQCQFRRTPRWRAVMIHPADDVWSAERKLHVRFRAHRAPGSNREDFFPSDDIREYANLNNSFPGISWDVARAARKKERRTPRPICIEQNQRKTTTTKMWAPVALKG